MGLKTVTEFGSTVEVTNDEEKSSAVGEAVRRRRRSACVCGGCVWGVQGEGRRFHSQHNILHYWYTVIHCILYRIVLHCINLLFQY